jgi:integrase
MNPELVKFHLPTTDQFSVAVDNLATRKITVRRSRVSVRGKVLAQATTKTRAGLRTVPLSDAAVGALLSWQLKQAAEAGRPGGVRTEGHVFIMEDGRPLDPSNVIRLFSSLRREGEPLPALSFHGLRHCAASCARLRRRYRRHKQAARPRVDRDHQRRVRAPGRYHRSEGRGWCRQPDRTHVHTQQGVDA